MLILQLARYVAHLGRWSEPAGVELKMRRDELSGRLGEVVLQIRAEYPQLIAGIQANLRERCLKALKPLSQIKKMREAGKFEIAEDQLIKLHDDLAIDGAWYPSVEESAPLIPFERLLMKLGSDLLPGREQAARDAINRRRDEQMPDYAGLLAQVGAATVAVTAARAVDVSGQKLDGPQALEFFLSRWQDLHFKNLHVRAMDSRWLNTRTCPMTHPRAGPIANSSGIS